MITETGRRYYFATGRPIRDSQNRIIGAVEIHKDMSEIKMLAQSITEPAQISFSDIIGSDPAIRSAVQFARKIASTDAIVSIRGDSGTGKELVATPSIRPAAGGTPLFPSTVRPCPNSSWKASCSATWGAPSPAAFGRASRAFSRLPRAVRCSWTKSPRCPWDLRPKSCG